MHAAAMPDGDKPEASARGCPLGCSDGRGWATAAQGRMGSAGVAGNEMQPSMAKVRSWGLCASFVGVVEGDWHHPPPPPRRELIASSPPSEPLAPKARSPPTPPPALLRLPQLRRTRLEEPQRHQRHWD